MKALDLGFAAGVATVIIVFLAMALSMWTVLHSGWSQAALDAYSRLMFVLPPVCGVAMGWLFFRLGRMNGLK